MGTRAPTRKRRDGSKISRHRHVSQYAVLVVNIIIVLACFIGAAGLVFGQNVVNGLQKTSEIAATPSTQALATPTTDGGSADSGPATTSAPFPDADPNAKNFLITGADNGACVSPSSPYYASIGDRTALGERSDTIMVMRVDPSTSRAAVLSFPRDLWVKIDGSNGFSRINSAYSLNDPQKLINTIFNNFGISIQHYIQIDFCAFKTLVDSVGGVAVPFEYPARDQHTGSMCPMSVATTSAARPGWHTCAAATTSTSTRSQANGRKILQPTTAASRASRTFSGARLPKFCHRARSIFRERAHSSTSHRSTWWSIPISPSPKNFSSRAYSRP